MGLEYCSNALEAYPISSYIKGSPNDIGILMFISGLVYILVSFFTVAWIKSQELRAHEGNNEAAQSVIFPVFIYVVWFSVFVSIFSAVVVTFVPQRPVQGNSVLVSILYATMWTLQHIIIDGISFMLMQKGCGKYAAYRAGRWTAIWAVFCFCVTFVMVKLGGIGSDIINLFWNFLLFVLYLLLWKIPQEQLYRRPAIYQYARFWAYYRLGAALIDILLFIDDTKDIGTCGYIFFSLILFSIFQPLLCYWTLLQDSKWWQGIEISTGGLRGSYENMKSPLLGTDFSIHSAQNLANTMDQIRHTSRVKMLNFAKIKLNLNNYLGAGSFSKVYRGYYRKQECAIKLIYTFDLTADVINRVAAEASILSAIRHPNVVNIYGVSVLPPSVCLLLELCSFGSLSDIIRGYGFDWSPTSKVPMTLSHSDKLFLALGCARGLAAVHSYDRKLCHRDIKSFNFLVDAQLNAKIADLELGLTDKYLRKGSGGDARDVEEKEEQLVVVEDLLANWMAPEVIRNRKYEQPSDVYSLSLVFWEIFSGQLPFDGDLQPAVREKLRSGYRHQLPACVENTAMAGLISRGWSENVYDRPTANEIVAELEVMVQESCYSLISEASSPPDFSQAIDYYEMLCHLHKDDISGNDYVFARKTMSSSHESGNTSTTYNPVLAPGISEGRLSWNPSKSTSSISNNSPSHIAKPNTGASTEDHTSDDSSNSKSGKVAMSLQIPKLVVEILGSLQVSEIYY